MTTILLRIAEILEVHHCTVQNPHDVCEQPDVASAIRQAVAEQGEREPIHVHLQGQIMNESQVQDVVVRAIQAANRRGRLTI